MNIEKPYGYYGDNILDDVVWENELTLDERKHVVQALRTMTIRSLAETKLLLADSDLTPGERYGLHRKRNSTANFLELVNSRATKVNAQIKEHNIERSSQEAAINYKALRAAVHNHRDVTSNPDSTDDELAAADDALYAVLDNPVMLP